MRLTKTVAALMFTALAVAPTAQGPRERAVAPGFTDAGKAALTEQMNAAVSSGDTPGVVAMVVNRDGVLFEGAAELPGLFGTIQAERLGTISSDVHRSISTRFSRRSWTMATLQVNVDTHY